MKHLFFIVALFITFICQGQTYNELKANRVIALKNLRLPDTVNNLKLSDSGSIAIKGTTIWIWSGSIWSNTQVIIDTSIISTKANAQKVVDDTAKVLRSLASSPQVRLNQIQSANSVALTDHTTYQQSWRWTNPGDYAFKMETTTASSFSNSPTLFVSKTGSGSGLPTRSLYVNNVMSNPSRNVAGTFTATGGSQNYALETIDGSIKFGTFNYFGSRFIKVNALGDLYATDTIYLSRFDTTSLISTKANTQKVVNDTAAVLRSLIGTGSGVTDGDKGDITVTGSGATWTVDNSAITYAKIQDAGANTIIGRDAGTSGILAEISTTRFPLFGSAITGTPSASTYLRGDGTWATPAGGGTSLSGLTAATGTNTINNANFTQEWQWNSLSATGAYGLKLTSNTTTRNGSATGGIMQIQSTGTNANSTVIVRGLDISIQNSGSGSQNFGIRAAALNGDINHGVYGEGSSSGLYGVTTTGNGVYGYASGGGGRGGQFITIGATGTNYGADASATGSGATANYGVRGAASGGSVNYGIYGTGTEYGVYGTSSTANGIGTYGIVTATTGTNNYGVQGAATGSGANTNYGGRFDASGATTNYGIYAQANTYGVYGSGSASGAAGVLGINNSSSGTVYGVRGITQGSGATTGYAFHAIASNATTNYAFYAQSGITKINSLEVAYTFHTSPTLTVDATHYFISADATTNNITINLPTASGIAGRVYIVKKIDASGNTVTIDPNGSETIDGASTNVLSTQYEYHMFVSNGSNWLIIGG